MTIDEKVKDAHCLGPDGQLHYKTEIKPEYVSARYKPYAGFCLVEAEQCPYHQILGQAHLCNNQWKSPYKEEKKYECNRSTKKNRTNRHH